MAANSDWLLLAVDRARRHFAAVLPLRAGAQARALNRSRGLRAHSRSEAPVHRRNSVSGIK